MCFSIGIGKETEDGSGFVAKHVIFIMGGGFAVCNNVMPVLSKGLLIGESQSYLDSVP
jgi:hypothetical protein